MTMPNWIISMLISWAHFFALAGVVCGIVGVWCAIRDRVVDREWRIEP